MAGLPFIIASIVVALLAIAAAGYGIGLRTVSQSNSTEATASAQPKPTVKRTYLRVDAEALTAALRQMHDILEQSVRESNMPGGFSPSWSFPRWPIRGEPLTVPTTALLNQIVNVRNFFEQLQAQMQSVAGNNASYRKEYLQQFVETVYPPQDLMDTLTQYSSFLNLLPSPIDKANARSVEILMQGFNYKLFMGIKDQYENRVRALAQIDAEIIEIGSSTE
jgi:hypothetical protein